MPCRNKGVVIGVVVRGRIRGCRNPGGGRREAGGGKARAAAHLVSVDARAWYVHLVPRGGVAAQSGEAVRIVDHQLIGQRGVTVHSPRAVAVEVDAVDGSGAYRSVRHGRPAGGAPVGEMCHQGARHTGGVGADPHLPQPHRAEQSAVLVDPAFQRAGCSLRVDHLRHEHAWEDEVQQGEGGVACRRDVAR